MKKLVVLFSVLLSIPLFAQVPAEPFNPMTANGARHIYANNNQWISHKLYWQNPTNVIYNDVYISTDSSLVINLDPTVKVLSGFDSLKSFSSLSLELLGILDLHTKYYWRVVEYNSIGFTAGPVWYFISQSSNYSYWDEEFNNGLSNYTIIPSQGASWSISNTNNAGGFNAPELLFNCASNFVGTSYLILNEPFDLCASQNPIFFNYSVDWISGEFTVGIVYSLNEGNTWQTLWQQNITEDIPITQIWTIQAPNENYVYLAFFCNNNFTGSSGNWYIDNFGIGTPLTIATPPTQIKALADSLSLRVNLIWNGASSPDPINGYRIQRKNGLPNDTSSYYICAETDANTFSYYDTNVQLEHTYTYRIQGSWGPYTTGWGNEATAYVPAVTPVELLSFSSSIVNNDVTLSWTTATETNNSGFEIERCEKLEARSEEWENVGFVNGHGTRTESQSYSIVDENLSAGKYQYRLKQIDFDGTFEYSNTIEVEINPPAIFSLEQNYPNPFNPTTKISWQSAVSGWQILKVFDVLGNEVATLVNEYKPAGNYDIEFDATKLSSGVYYYQLKAGEFIQSRKMILLK